METSLREEVCVSMMPSATLIAKVTYENTTNQPNGLDTIFYYNKLKADTAVSLLLSTQWTMMIYSIMKCFWKIRAHPEEFVRNKIAFTKLKYATASMLHGSYDSGIAKPDIVFRASESNDSHLRPSSFNNLLSSFVIEVDCNMTEILEYTMERNWNKFDQPRNLVLAILNEIGELLQIFLWRNDGPSDHLDNEVRICAAYELEDILIFSMRFGFYMDYSLTGALMAVSCTTVL